ncbi:unnamed protein product [Paramecium sonneborni]|uniref:Uncharacterized protein n=1 Tax=Paramecium sonneborni TaxID=65129 RepID=A0A8S1RPR3_9CILI|nr:unnamed protein product [Paramecium sonneborni]
MLYQVIKSKNNLKRISIASIVSPFMQGSQDLESAFFYQRPTQTIRQTSIDNPYRFSIAFQQQVNFLQVQFFTLQFFQEQINTLVKTKQQVRPQEIRELYIKYKGEKAGIEKKSKII